MKTITIMCLSLMSFTSSASVDISQNTIEYSIVNYPGGNKKSKRKIRRKNRKRKRHCQRSARRNFAG